MVCPQCTTANLVQDVRDISSAYRGQSTVLSVASAAFCPACVDGMFERTEANRISAALLAFRQAVHAA